MKNKSLKFVLIFSLALNASMLSGAGYFFYRHHGRRPYGRISGRERMILDRISLRPDQTEALREKSRGFQTLMDKKRDEMTDLRKVLFFILFTDNPDRQKINDMIDEINVVQRETQTAVAEHILDEKAVMDGQQREKFYEIIETSLESRRPHGGGAENGD